MGNFVIRLCCSIIGLFCLFFMFFELIDNWTDSSLLHKFFSILAILGWVDINYNLITLRYHWLRRTLGEK